MHDIGDRVRPQVERAVSDVFGPRGLLGVGDHLHGIPSDDIVQEPAIVVVREEAFHHRVVRVRLRVEGISWPPERNRLLEDPVRRRAVHRRLALGPDARALDVLRSLDDWTQLMLRCAPSAHFLELAEVLSGQKLSKLRPVFYLWRSRLRDCSGEGSLRHEAHPTILCQSTEVQVRQETLLILVEVLKDLIDLLDAELDAQVIKVLLELCILD